MVVALEFADSLADQIIGDEAGSYRWLSTWMLAVKISSSKPFLGDAFRV